MNPNYNSLPQQVLQEMNRARTSPKSMITHLQHKLQFFKGNSYLEPGMSCTLSTNEGPDAVKSCIAALIQHQPCQRMTLMDGLSEAARDHCNDTGPRGITGHSGSDGSTMGGRMERYGEWQSGIAENISYGHADAREIVLQLLIDDGVSSRGHRKNLLNQSYLVCGISAGPHKQYQHMCVQDFAVGFVPSGPGGGHHAPKSQHHAPQHHAPQHHAPQQYAPQHHAPQQYAPQHYAPQQYAPQHHAPDQFQQTSMGCGNDDFFNDFNKDWERQVQVMNSGHGGCSGGKQMGGGGGHMGGGGGSDSGMPYGAVKCVGTSSSTNTVNGKTVKKSTKKYQMQDGSIKEITEENRY
jgi:uncharacterized protein YkwD